MQGIIEEDPVTQAGLDREDNLPSGSLPPNPYAGRRPQSHQGQLDQAEGGSSSRRSRQSSHFSPSDNGDDESPAARRSIRQRNKAKGKEPARGEREGLRSSTRRVDPSDTDQDNADNSRTRVPRTPAKRVQSARDHSPPSTQKRNKPQPDYSRRRRDPCEKCMKAILKLTAQEGCYDRIATSSRPSQRCASCDTHPCEAVDQDLCERFSHLSQLPVSPPCPVVECLC